MEKVRCVVIEDEPDNRQNLRLLIANYCPQLEIVAEAESVAEGLRIVRQTRPELIFLDVELQDGTGFDLLAGLQGLDVNIIFVTAYTHYAIKAIKFNAVDYIMKPIDIGELCQAVDKASRKTEAKDNLLKIRNLISNLGTPENGNKRIALASVDALKMVEVKNILRLEGENNYTRFYFKSDPPTLVSRTIKEYEAMLQDYDFFRVHQSHLVNMAYVASYVKGEGGYVVMTDGAQVAVSRHRKAELLERLSGS
ncbi:MAG: response regulator transcription factor [Bacteroidetes bacterium]|nr:response regulator transcription factor [Bacteroidota bacterium]